MDRLVVYEQIAGSEIHLLAFYKPVASDLRIFKESL
jgi:hypothetical protein